MIQKFIIFGKTDTPKFIADCHLGKLAKYLRLMGVDTLFFPHIEVDALIVMANNENRTILTRDRTPSQRKNTGAFLRCIVCNTPLKGIAKMLGMPEERIEEVLQGLETINTDKKEKGLLNFCIKASKKDNYKILKEEIDVLQEMGCSDVQILKTVSIRGYFNYINTLSNVFCLRQS